MTSFWDLNHCKSWAYPKQLFNSIGCWSNLDALYCSAFRWFCFRVFLICMGSGRYQAFYISCVRGNTNLYIFCYSFIVHILQLLFLTLRIEREKKYSIFWFLSLASLLMNLTIFSYYFSSSTHPNEFQRAPVLVYLLLRSFNTFLYCRHMSETFVTARFSDSAHISSQLYVMCSGFTSQSRFETTGKESPVRHHSIISMI